MISELQRKWEATPAHRQRADLIISIPVKHAVYIRSVVPISPTFKLWRSPGCYGGDLGPDFLVQEGKERER